MKLVCIPIDEDVHKKLKMYLVETEETMKGFVQKAIMKKIISEELNIISRIDDARKRRIDIREGRW